MHARDPFKNLTPDQYLAYERQHAARHEYLAGEVYAMAGASERHNHLTSTLNFLLYGGLLGRPCAVFQSDMRVQTADAYFYPDVVVTCGEARYSDDHRDTLLNPTLIIEVLSPTTEDFDKGRKFTQYRQITTLQDYVLVAQSAMRVEHFTRHQSDLWTLHEHAHAQDILRLPSIQMALTLADIYQKITFDDLT